MLSVVLTIITHFLLNKGIKRKKLLNILNAGVQRALIIYQIFQLLSEAKEDELLSLSGLALRRLERLSELQSLSEPPRCELRFAPTAPVNDSTLFGRLLTRSPDSERCVLSVEGKFLGKFKTQILPEERRKSLEFQIHWRIVKTIYHCICNVDARDSYSRVAGKGSRSGLLGPTTHLIISGLQDLKVDCPHEAILELRDSNGERIWCGGEQVRLTK